MVDTPINDELIQKDYIYHVAFVDELNFFSIDEKYRCTRGRPAYPRRMLLKLLLMDYTDCVLSSRKITKLQMKMWFICTLMVVKILIPGLYVILKFNANIYLLWLF